MGSLHNIDFGVFWACWGGSGKKPGSGNRFREPFDGFWQTRFCSRGLDATGSGNRVPGTKGIQKVPDSGDSVPKVPKVTLYFESILLYFESYFCTSKVYLFCPLKGHFCTLKVYFCTLKVYFCTSKIYLFCPLKGHFVLWKYTSVLRKYALVLRKLLFTRNVYFCALKVYFCTLPQCLLQVALTIYTARAKKKW